MVERKLQRLFELGHRWICNKEGILYEIAPDEKHPGRWKSRIAKPGSYYPAVSRPQNINEVDKTAANNRMRKRPSQNGRA